MAASYANFDWALRNAGTQQGMHRRGSGGDIAAKVTDTQDWAGAAAASAQAGAAKTAAIVRGSADLASTGVSAQGRLGEQALAATANVVNSSMNAATGAFQAKTQADAMVKQAKLAYGDSPLDYMRFAGGLGVLAYGMSDTGEA